MKFLCFLLVTNIFVLDVSYALNEDCTTANCTTKEKSICIDGTCQCDKLFKYSGEQEKCLNYVTEYNTLCYEDWQCEDFIGDNSQCLNNACLCKKGYRWYQGKCQKYASKGESCDDKVICLDGSSPLSLNCTDHICQCSDGYYEREGDCRLKSEVDKECAINGDCFPTPDMFGILTYSHCELGKCIKNDSSAIKLKSKVFNNIFSYTRPSSVLEKFLDGNLDTTTQNTKPCTNGVSADLPVEDCLECLNTIYFKNLTCICKQGYFLMDGQCVAELGMKDINNESATDKDCPLKPGKAVNGACFCKDYWFQDSTNRECKKTTLEYTKSCLDNDWCKAMGPYAFCNTDTEKCQCSSQAVLNETSFYCNLKSDADLSNICFENSACPLYETCADEKCQCDEGFFRVNKTSLCLPKIGYSCAVRDCSHIDNAICGSNEICQCQSNSFVSDGYVCLHVVPNLDDDCEITQQCKNIPHAECLHIDDAKNATSQCLCSDEYLDVEGACYAVKAPGSQCSTKFNCTIILGDTFECRNNLCQCPLGSTLNEHNVCVASSASRRRNYSVLPVFLILFMLLWFKIE